MRIAFRVDGNRKIGMGHIMRSISLALEFRKKGHELFFLCKFNEGINKILNEGFNVIRLEFNEFEEEWDSEFVEESTLQEEASQITRLTEANGIEVLFIDTYKVNHKYLLSIKTHVKRLAYIDDLNKFVYPVDLLIHGSIVGMYKEYEKYDSNEIILSGLRYNLIRDEFRDLPMRTISKEVSSCLITAGGADIHNMCYKIANTIINDKDLFNIRINIIVGSNKEYLRKFAAQYENVNLYENVNNISSIMMNSDIAFSAGGSTLYELCACGTPTLSFVIAENQEFIVQKMDEMGYIKNLGWYNEIDDTMIAGSLKLFIEDYDNRTKMSKEGQQLVDGNGTCRIVNVIESTI